jgi:PKHD-type hydroxylase
MDTQATYLPLENLLSQEQLHQLNTLCQQATYTDGKLTATGAAKEVKNNLQMDAQSEQFMVIQQVLMTALNQSALFVEATFIKTIYPFVLSKYHTGMEYGWHVDRPLMGNRMRTDIAITIFLNDPADYDGGELELQTPAGTQLYKLPAGHAICYPSTQLHRVRPVTKGERRAAVSWIESMVKSSEQRQLLFDVQQTINTLLADNVIGPANTLQQIHSNLLRMWAE